MSATISRRKALRIAATSGTAAAALLTTLGGGLVFGQPAVGQSGGSSGSTITVYVLRSEQGVKGPDGTGHDAFVPSSFVLQSGVPTTLNIINYDEGLHTITAPDLGLNLMINPGSAVGDVVQPVTTSATVTVSQAGVYRWYCAVDCDGGGAKWAMSDGYDGKDQDGFMAGNIVVL
jgi:plastocyanin